MKKAKVNAEKDNNYNKGREVFYENIFMFRFHHDEYLNSSNFCLNQPVFEHFLPFDQYCFFFVVNEAAFVNGLKFLTTVS